MGLLLEGSHLVKSVITVPLKWSSEIEEAWVKANKVLAQGHDTQRRGHLPSTSSFCSHLGAAFFMLRVRPTLQHTGRLAHQYPNLTWGRTQDLAQEMSKL